MSEEYCKPSFCSRAYAAVKRHAYAPVTFAIVTLAGYAGLMAFHDPAVSERVAQEQRVRALEQEKRARRTTLERIIRQPEKHVFPAIDGLLGNGNVPALSMPESRAKNE